jgi:predicted P-loop ATPase
MRAVASSGLQPAWDELKQLVILRAPKLPWHVEKHGRVLNDEVLLIARFHLTNVYLESGYSPSKENLYDALRTAAYSAKFNPVADYLDGLQWDGKPRVVQLFPRYFNCGDDEYTRAVSVCFMVAAVRRQRQPGCKFDNMPILQSPQGWLKSTAIGALFHKEWTSDANLGSLRDKDSAMLLRGIWCQEFAELEGLNRADSTALKAFCSRAVDRQRDPYARVAEDVPRRCVFIGTTNESGFLKDSTGSRRFWPLEVGASIDVARIAADRDQLWAEAAYLEAQGTSDVLPRHLWAIAGERQAEQTSSDPWADVLQDFLERRGRDDGPKQLSNPNERRLPADRVLTRELLDALGIATADRTKDKAQRLRVIMESTLGWHYRKGVRVLDTVQPGYTRARLADKE